MNAGPIHITPEVLAPIAEIDDNNPHLPLIPMALFHCNLSGLANC